MVKINTFQTPDELFKASANRILELYKHAVEKKGTFTIAFSGGTTPKKLYELLSTPAYSDQINWKLVYVFWGDERCVPLSHKDNNSHMAAKALLNNVPIPQENIFRVPVNFEPAKAAAQYEQMIKKSFRDPLPRFDLVLLGLGEDGHTASLFPGTEILEEKKALVKQVYLEDKNSYRVSFTVTLINNARNIVFLVLGKEKAVILGRIFNKPVKKNRYPVQLIKTTNGNIFWHIDKDAASHLNS